MLQSPAFAPFLQNADHIDVKTIEGSVSLRQFLAGMIGYQPGWVTFLYGIRKVFVRLLGMRQQGMPRPLRLTPETVPMQAGQKLSFFTTQLAKEDEYWLGEVDDSHLRASLGVIVEPLSETQRRFHVVTIVHYHNWAGPVYFNIIRPFHHLVVGGMAKAGIGDHQPAE